MVLHQDFTSGTHMSDLANLLPVLTTFFVVAASPGPATLATATVSMQAGRSNGMRFGAGLGVGLAFWGLIAATGLGTVLHASSIVLIAMKLLGGVYLLWLAYSSLRSAKRATAHFPEMNGAGKWFIRGLVLNLSNPKAVVAWMATLSLGFSDNSSAWQVATATLLCVGLGLSIYAGYVIVFSTDRAMQIYSRSRRWIDRTVAALFAVAGLGLIRSAVLRS